MSNNNGFFLHKRYLLILIIVIASVVGLFIIYKKVERDQLIQKNKDQFLLHANLHGGDLIFRKGRSLASQAVLVTDRSTEYSHVGIVVNTNNQFNVIHAVPGESESGIDYLINESINSFVAGNKASKIGVYRCTETSFFELQKIANKAVCLYKDKVEFDNEYDLSSDRKMYCTELIWKLYKLLDIDLIDNQFDLLQIPVVGGDFILPGSFIKSTHLTKIYEF